MLNNSHFEIERSENGLHFEKIGEVRGSGTTAEVKHYQYMDPAPLKKMNYYRLRQVDLDGTSAYSRIVYVLFSEEKSGNVLYPNPAFDFVTIKYEGEEKEVVARLYNGSGQCLKSDLYKTPENIRLDIKDLAPGSYLVQVLDGVSQQTLRFVKK
ncbi:T9SS type A sorting domain-containing protein [Dyadobacter luticola]|uniref:T9SS type A sorting domain-containing protein n=1 Tax=Dyadobacter luticola TaxID=1979387 RepID=A0A5R9L5C5_9BACT|nr:T9SS type A sorting domain-containing protein [Dyadobacter luticola]TLV03772.1 T9SS type A sorting domain-containing protein [Dyadobacter luticola]